MVSGSIIARHGPGMRRVYVLLADYASYHSARGGLVSLLEFVLLAIAARAIADWRVGLGAFVVGWVFQGIGHVRYEKNRPAFFKNLVHLMVGPLFLLNELFGIRPAAL